MKRFPLVALALLAAACTTSGPLAPLSGGTARQAWQHLERSAAETGTLSSYASLKISTPEGKKSFRAAIDVDSEGAVRMRAFTPVGTEVFVFEVRQGEMVFADHGAQKWWRGPFTQIASQLGIPPALSAADFAHLVFGLPAESGTADLSRLGEGVVRQGEFEYEVTGVGLASVTEADSAWTVRYEPVMFPPEKVIFADESGRSITVRHLDLSRSGGRLEELRVDESYRCCFAPVISPD